MDKQLLALMQTAVLTKASDLVRHAHHFPPFASDHFRMTWKEFESAVMQHAALIADAQESTP